MFHVTANIYYYYHSSIELTYDTIMFNILFNYLTIIILFIMFNIYNIHA